MPKKLTKSEVQNRISSKGILVGDDYKKVSERCTFTCPVGHVWVGWPNGILNKDHGCPHCAGLHPLSKEDVQEKLQHRQFVIGEDFVNGRTKCSVTCEFGHTWSAKPNQLLIGKGCPDCYGRKRLSKEDLQAKIASKGFVVGDDYVNARTKCTFTCSLGHTWETPPQNIHQGKGCPFCADRRSDNDSVYIWRSVGESFQGLDLYKVGITSSRLDIKRINHVAYTSGKIPEIIIVKKVENAKAIESGLKTFGVNPGYRGFDGATEFRAMSEDELRRAISFVEWAT